MQYSEEEVARADTFSLGKYFNKYAGKIWKGVLPTKQFDEEYSASAR